MKSIQAVSRRKPTKLGLALAVAGLAGTGSVLAEPALLSEQALVDSLDTYCAKCHNFEDFAGGMALELLDFSDMSGSMEVGEEIVRKLSAGVMPPAGETRPDSALNDRMVASLEAKLDSVWAATPALVPPGVHRLNRAEYENVVRDLLALDVDASTLLPVDDTSYGFDNMAGSLGSSPALIESYISAAAKISRLALGHELAPTQKDYLAPADYSQNRHMEGLPFGTRGGLLVEHYFPADGEYVFSWAPIRDNAGGLFGSTTGEELELSVDGERVKLYSIDDDVPRRSSEDRIELRVPVTAGLKKVALTFLSKTHIPNDDLNQHFERTTLTQNVSGFKFSPHVNKLSIAGPFEASRPQQTASRERVFSCYPQQASEEADCARSIVGTLARKAYRRPVGAEDMQHLLSFYEAGRKDGDFESGIQRALQVILSDPAFIYRAEQVNVELAGTGDYYPVSQLELASRLSFFLWSSAPDDELMQLATDGKLRQPDILEQQVERMLADPRSHALVQNFAAQWLQLRNLASAAPVATLFPDFDDNLREALRTETEMFFESIMREDQNVVRMLDANYTFLNERLAKHYGIPGIYGSQFRRVELPPEFDDRRGLLGKGSIQTVSSVADRTSTVRRGKWVLLNILGVVPPEPPPNVPALEEVDGAVAGPQTMRERMTMHATNPACASCHQMMDPIGFALESFNAIGQERDREAGKPLDLSGRLVDGQTFNGPSELREALMHYSPRFVQMLTERLLTYALGRGVEYYDMPVVRDIARKAAEHDNRFSALVLGIVESQPFQNNQIVSENLSTAER